MVCRVERRRANFTALTFTARRVVTGRNNNTPENRSQECREKDRERCLSRGKKTASMVLRSRIQLPLSLATTGFFALLSLSQAQVLPPPAKLFTETVSILFTLAQRIQSPEQLLFYAVYFVFTSPKAPLPLRF